MKANKNHHWIYGTSPAVGLVILSMAEIRRTLAKNMGRNTYRSSGDRRILSFNSTLVLWGIPFNQTYQLPASTPAACIHPNESGTSIDFFCPTEPHPKAAIKTVLLPSRTRGALQRMTSGAARTLLVHPVFCDPKGLDVRMTT